MAALTTLALRRAIILPHSRLHASQVVLRRALQTRAVDAPPAAPILGVVDPSEAHNDWVSFHPVYKADELKTVKVVKWKKTTITDHVASGMVKVFRKGFDVVTGYRHSDPAAAVEQAKKEAKSLALADLRKQGYVMTPDQWMSRILFLESIAGVPGMVAGILRHLRSLRTAKRDYGWINTLLSEAENERMHLMTFVKIAEPSLFMRLCLLGAQGVFFNMFFLAYMISPRACHRFVGSLEEEAVYTYTLVIQEVEAGRLPEWSGLRAPQIARDYWRMPEDATMLDLLYNVRADESQHRFVNNTLANLDTKKDQNPFAVSEPTAETRGTVAGLSREEALKWTEQAEALAKSKLAKKLAKASSS